MLKSLHCTGEFQQEEYYALLIVPHYYAISQCAPTEPMLKLCIVQVNPSRRSITHVLNVLHCHALPQSSPTELRQYFCIVLMNSRRNDIQAVPQCTPTQNLCNDLLAGALFCGVV